MSGTRMIHIQARGRVSNNLLEYSPTSEYAHLGAAIRSDDAEVWSDDAAKQSQDLAIRSLDAAIRSEI